MTTFTIDSANHITAWATEKEAARAEAGRQSGGAAAARRLAGIPPPCGHGAPGPRTN